IGTKTPRKRMVDEELLLRVFALRAGLDKYRTPLKRFLNNYAAEAREFDQQQLVALSDCFNNTIANVSILFGRGAFRIADRNGRPLENIVNRALFDAQMLACSWIQNGPTVERANEVKREVSELYNDPSFLDSIQRATGDRARTLKRLRDTISALERAGV